MLREPNGGFMLNVKQDCVGMTVLADCRHGKRGVARQPVCEAFQPGFSIIGALDALSARSTAATVMTGRKIASQALMIGS